jgi:hypothetical protein
MTSPSVLTFEYVPESQTLELSGDLVASWDEKDRRIASISTYGLGDLKKIFRKDVQGIEKAYGSRLHWEDKPRYVYAYLEELSLAGYGFWENLTGDRDLRWLRRIEESLAPGSSGDWWSALESHALAKSVYHIETKGPPETIRWDSLPTLVSCATKLTCSDSPPSSAALGLSFGTLPSPSAPIVIRRPAAGRLPST